MQPLSFEFDLHILPARKRYDAKETDKKIVRHSIFLVACYQQT
jgi:hypothetical protein